MKTRGISGSTAVIGVGNSDFLLRPTMSNAALAVQAMKRALGLA